MMSFNSGSIITSTRTEKSIVKTNVSFIRSRAIVVKVLYELSSLFGVCLPLFMSPYPMVPALSDLCHFHFVIFMLYRRRKNNNFALKKTEMTKGRQNKIQRKIRNDKHNPQIFECRFVRHFEPRFVSIHCQV